MTKSKRPSSGRWRQRQAADPFVKHAQSQGWRSRAVFKLMQIQAADRVLQRGAVVVDLGAAPGSWSQYAQQVVGAKGRVFAVDLLDMEPLPGVSCICGDFRVETTWEALQAELEGAVLDLVLSDMAPNISGNWAVDQPRTLALAQEALAFSRQRLRAGGSVVIKLFQGEGTDEFVKEIRAAFQSVRLRKPQASRAESREIYVLARNHRL